MPVIAPLQPHDSLNQSLENHVHPPDWQNPVPEGRYNLVVIGAGTAGLVSAIGAAGLGAKVALIERELMGGDCLNVGCVPSKAVISAARSAASVNDAGEFGVEVPAGARVDFAAVMERMRRLRASIAPHDSAARFRDLGIDVFFGNARFTGENVINVDGTRLQFKKAVIATGARAAAPPIPGLDSVPYLTNETVFSLTELPARFGVIGGGPIGCEMAQSFARFGAEVVLIDKADTVLPREDASASQIVQSALERDGVEFLFGVGDMSVHSDAQGGITISVATPAGQQTRTVDQLLVAVGRKPNVESLDLHTVGVDYDPRLGVTVNHRLQTTNPRIFAAGDVCSIYKFTHAADFMARIVIQNALFPLVKASAERLIVPWCTYTSPELAHVGLSERDAHERRIPIETYTQELAHVDRAILESETEGFVKVLTKRGSDKILGATIVARNAGDMISEITLAMKHGIGLKRIGGTIHPYPTQAEAIRKLGDQYSKTRMTPTLKALLEKWMHWTR